MAARRKVSLEPIADMIDVQVKRLKQLRARKGANKARVDKVVETLGKMRKACTNECRTDFFINPFSDGSQEK